jgi:hypothetical protein
MSQSTCAVLEDDEFAGASLKDLGEHQLKDFDRSERIYQLLVDGLPNNFAPLKARDAQPVKATPFAGQESELAAAAQAAVKVKSRRRSLEAAMARIRLRATRWRTSIIRFPYVARRAATKPINIVVQTAVVVFAIAVQPWIILLGLAFYALLLWWIVRRLRASSLEVIGWRLRMSARIAPNERLREQVSALASAIIRAAQACARVDRYLKTTDRRWTARRLDELRGVPAVSRQDLDAADAVARQIKALDALVERRGALHDESERLAVETAEVPERLYEARLEATSVKGLSTDVAQMLDRIHRRRTELEEASDVARLCDVTERRGRSRWRPIAD